MIITDNNDALQGTEYKTLIAEAHSDFQQSVINGISKLRESGFSKQRAIEILLTFVRQKDPVPSDDEIFQVMHTLRLGFHHAMQCLIVAKAVSRIQQIGGLEKVQAIQSLSKDITRYIQEFSIPTIILDQQNMEASHAITTEDVAFLKVNLSSSHATTTRKGPSTPSSVVHPPTHTANGSSTGSNTNTSTKSNPTHHSIRNATNVKKSLPRTNKQIRKRKDEEEHVVSGVVGSKEEREHIRKSSPKRSTRSKRIREDETSTGHASNGNGTDACHAASGASNGIPEAILVDGNLMVSSKRPRLDSV